MKNYAALWHVQWERQALAGKFPRSWTAYENALSLRFDDKEARDEAYTELEKIRYQGDIRDMFTKIQIHNDKAQLTGAGLKKLILHWLSVNVLEQVHTVGLTRKTDREMIEIISRAGRNAEKWVEVKKTPSTRRPRSSEKNGQKHKDEFGVQKTFQQNDRKPDMEKQFVNRNDKSVAKTSRSQIEGIPQAESVRRFTAKKWLRCAWPVDRKGSHHTMDCYIPIKIDPGSASFPKAKEHQKMKIRAYELEEDWRDMYTEESGSKELRDTALEKTEESEESLESERCCEIGRNWWESDWGNSKQSFARNFSSEDDRKIETAGQ